MSRYEVTDEQWVFMEVVLHVHLCAIEPPLLSCARLEYGGRAFGVGE